MGKLNKDSKVGELDFLKADSGIIESVSASESALWAYDSSSANANNWKYKRVVEGSRLALRAQEVIRMPKRYKGRKLSKSEIRFLLNARKAWAAGAISNQEHVDSLLSIHRSIMREHLDGAVFATAFGSALVGLAAFSAGAVALGTLWNLGLVAVFGIGFGGFFPIIAASTLLQLVPKYKRASIEIEEAFLNTDTELIHPDYKKYRKYLEKEWSSMSFSTKDAIDALHPSPSMIDVYVERNRAIKELENTRNKGLAKLSMEMLSKSIDQNQLATKLNSNNSVLSWDPILLIFENVKNEWSEWEMDILKVVQYPSLFDMREDATVKFHRALISAESKKPQSGQSYSESHPFSNAVTELQLAWTIAKTEAERIKQSHFKEEERVRLSRALDLLNLALNTSGTPAERQASYKRAMKQLEGLVRIPDVARDGIESGMGLKALEA